MHAKMVACMRSQICNENAAMKYDIIMQVREAEDAFKRPLLIRRNNSSIVKQTLKNFIFMKQERNESMSSLNKAISSSCESSHNMKTEKSRESREKMFTINIKHSWKLRWYNQIRRCLYEHTHTQRNQAAFSYLLTLIHTHKQAYSQTKVYMQLYKDASISP